MKNEKREPSTESSSFSSRRDIDDMKILFDLINQKIIHVLGPFVLRSPPSLRPETFFFFFVRLRKVKKSFLPSHLFPTTSCFRLRYCQTTEKKIFEGEQREANLSTFLLLCTSRLAREEKVAEKGRKLSHLFTFKTNSTIKLSSLRSNLEMILQIAF